jgi:hypothetical protein
VLWYNYCQLGDCKGEKTQGDRDTRSTHYVALLLVPFGLRVKGVQLAVVVPDNGLASAGGHGGSFSRGHGDGWGGCGCGCGCDGRQGGWLGK